MKMHIKSWVVLASVLLASPAYGQSLPYATTTPAGSKLKALVSNADAALRQIPTVWALAQGSTKAPVGTTPAAGDIPEMLETGFAATVVTMTIDQSAGGQGGNCANEDTYTGGTSLAVGTIHWQEDGGSTAYMVVRKTSGTFQADEIVTCGSSSNTAQIDVLDLTPGDGDDKFEGENMFGVQAGIGGAFYTALSALNTNAASLADDDLAQFFQGD